MSDGFPLWLKLVLRLERTIGAQVETAVHSDAYFDLLAQFGRTRRGLIDVTEGVSKRLLHLANLPAGTDIRRVREQLAGVERQLIRLSKELDEQRASSHAAR